MSASLLIRNALLSGHIRDVLIENEIIAEIGASLRGSMPSLDAKGAELIPGLIDHHIHLLATAAQANSLALTGDEDFAAALRAKDDTLAPDQHLRVTGYHDSFFGPLDAARLDALVPDRPVRVQYRTGSLWVLNTAALKLALKDGGTSDCVERDARGQPTGRIWRGDEWLRRRLPAAPPSLLSIGEKLARQGVTHITDASANTREDTAKLFTEAMARKDIPQHLMLMSANPLQRTANAPWCLGPVKILLDDHALPPVEEVTQTIVSARMPNRRVAVHCVTAGELALTLAAFSTAGSLPGDRIEHGGIITEEAISEIKRLGLTVVTQPGFIAERGDSYLEEVEPYDHNNLYRCASLIDAGIKIAGSTDAPYTRPDVWAAISAATKRVTKNGVKLGASERLSARDALALFQGSFDDPGGPARRIEVGASADLAILRDSYDTIVADDFADPVAATIVSGEVVWADEPLS
jgi:predicted amidohydrolase YtcJ